MKSITPSAKANYQIREWGVANNNFDDPNQFQFKASIATSEHRYTVLLTGQFDEERGSFSLVEDVIFYRTDMSQKDYETLYAEREQKQRKASELVELYRQASFELRKSYRHYSGTLPSGIQIATQFADDWPEMEPITIGMKDAKSKDYLFSVEVGEKSLAELINAAPKWKDWAAKARANHVKGFQKDVISRRSGSARIRMLFVVTPAGAPQMKIVGSYGMRILVIDEGDVDGFVAALQQIRATLQDAISAAERIARSRAKQARTTTVCSSDAHRIERFGCALTVFCVDHRDDGCADNLHCAV